MRAASYARFGAASDVLEITEIEMPTPGPGEVRVRLAFSGVNPSDAKARAGARPGVTKPAFPRIIPHSDGAGEIDAVGAGVDAARIGSRIWIWNGQWQRAFGTAAQFICLPSAQAVDIPSSVSLETGATLGIPGLTAAQVVFGGGDIAGKTLLISGGAGAVGHNAVQLAKWGGAKVIATARGAGLARALEAGADSALDYTNADLAAEILEASGGGIDRAIEVEFGANIPLLAEVMRPLGTIAAYGSGAEMMPTLPFGPFLFKALKIDITLIYLLPEAERAVIIERLHSALTTDALRPAIQAVLPLENCAEAHDAVMTPGRSGAILLDMA
ncbi:NADPH:quinone reductase [Roseovarius sp. LXJ103]|uniref:NADPH:quinone reductase n=1 Tax=Roseovarius carneus TaxID=2853164 RepID=UPI000D61B8DA|nr:NADPH:quinone reductase [Roseovarius carneus]MBZ8119724.1 NADPH:quinone reductase [Roseovarius carneus]PWE34670.1 zinc-binding dehydrogenase [Pelagicola sp. LXJ1103]